MNAVFINSLIYRWFIGPLIIAYKGSFINKIFNRISTYYEFSRLHGFFHSYMRVEPSYKHSLYVNALISIGKAFDRVAGAVSGVFKTSFGYSMVGAIIDDFKEGIRKGYITVIPLALVFYSMGYLMTAAFSHNLSKIRLLIVFALLIFAVIFGFLSRRKSWLESSYIIRFLKYISD